MILEAKELTEGDWVWLGYIFWKVTSIKDLENVRVVTYEHNVQITYSLDYLLEVAP